MGVGQDLFQFMCCNQLANFFFMFANKVRLQRVKIRVRVRVGVWVRVWVRVRGRVRVRVRVRI
jgi:hypothetical protein